MNLLTTGILAFFALAIQAFSGQIIIRLKPDELASTDTIARSPSYGDPNSLDLRANYATTTKREIWIKFPGIETLPATVNWASIWLYNKNLTGYFYDYASLRLFEPSKSWIESVKWNTRPASKYLISYKLFSEDENWWMGLNVSKYYSQFRTNKRGVRMAVGYKEDVSFHSSSSPTYWYRPELAVGIQFPDLINPIAKQSGTNWVAQSFPGTSQITSDFGEPWDGDGDQKTDLSINGYQLLHTGIDLRASANNPILASHSGTAYNVAEMSSNFGWRVSIRYELGGGKYVTTTYLHLNQPQVVNGSYVNAGQQIGSVWDLSKFGFGNHLHMQMRYGNQSFMPTGASIDIVTIGRLPETKDDTKQLNGIRTGILPSFPEWFINLGYDVQWETR